MINELLELKNKFLGVKDVKKENCPLINLDDKVDAFIEWYYKNMVKGHFSDISEYREPKEMRNFIEKVAVWYELRYPDYEINKLMYCCSQEQVNINDVMFKNNLYIKCIADKDSDIKYLDWDDFYNTNVFIKSLSSDERWYFSKPRYNYIVYLNPSSRSSHLHLTRNGYVEDAEFVSAYTKGVIKDKDLVGMHLKKVVELFNEKNISLPYNNELEKEIYDVDKAIYQKEEMLNCIMYRIIERGGNRIGPRRGFLFAKEFDRNIDIPMMYAVDTSDPGLRLFINEYIKAGGSKDLKCYKDYFIRTSKYEKLDTVSIQELILMKNYTEEENYLHQKLADLISSRIDYDIVRKEEFKRLRLERKISKV